MSVDLRSKVTPDGHLKSILSIMTRDLDTARKYWSEATEADLGDLKLYWDPNNPEEVAAAEAAYKAAKKKGVAFFMMDALDAKDGVKLDSDLTFAQATEKATREKPQRVQGAPPVRGGIR